MLRRLFPMAALIALATVLLGGCSKDCVECPKESPVLHLSTHRINLGTDQNSATLSISNKGGQTMSWTVGVQWLVLYGKQDAAEEIGWLTVSPTSGSGDATITCTADRSKLDKLGISQVRLIVNAPDAANTTRDSVEVMIVKANDWLINDDNTFDSCATAAVNDWYWVKEFHLPSGVEAVIVDSISFNFCNGSDSIMLLAYDWTVMDNDPNRVKFPGRPLFASTPPYPKTTSGWNSYPVNWYISVDTFYLGYFQLGASSPILNIDISPADAESTGCWTARDVSTDSTKVELAWYIEGVSKTFAIRAHVKPTFQYVGKPGAGTSSVDLWNALELGYQQRGTRLTHLCPLRHD
ncbi:MAG: hypothetical protein NT028_13885 [candidate division Zixibacteria bacterium]|nr:hypothetical protein [candidate division Zixibacteria bacterium]